ncbi:uncharacterized protein K02A2.6-like [Toxorhynchites rutilus septentrionalis]|uniref:uncharacterized protein K02A2.6-like n=1 Tax=Toxorhynchites rutilus septentrionalis TaxID=329112 RepID=UPI002479AE3E|nr:uncharacterized protein K02A2.6-like [Toxorhynchites rutilus septentrionalis]
MVWRCFSWYGIGPLYWVDKIMNQYLYAQILRDVMLRHAEWEMPLKWKFMQDGYPKHSAKTVKKWFQDNKVNVMVKLQIAKVFGVHAIGPAVHPFFSRREGLQVSQDCVTFCDRVVFPERFRKRIIRQLHRGHPGIGRMKSLARSPTSPNIDDDVESRSPTSKPWDRVHIDYAGPVDGYYYLVVVDAYSKWPEIFRTRTTTTTVTLEILQETIARYGNPHSLVSDNGTQFVSSRFKQFCKENGIQHLTTTPYHPQSNGQAERFVDALKRGLKKLVEGEKAVMFQDLQTFLSVYRSTPNRSIDGKTPAHLFLGRPLRMTLDVLKPCPPSPRRSTKSKIPSSTDDMVR